VLTGTAFERFPVPSPDGQWIAFLSDRSGVTNLWVSRPMAAMLARSRMKPRWC
jgi:Tol biopolymer transport system component